MNPGILLDDRFEFERQIGSGGMGTVFRARDRATGNAVAVKIVAEGQPTHAERFAREIEMLAELSHPGIVRHVAHGTMPSGGRFLVMEWLDGEDLKTRLARAELSTREAILLATRVAEALGAAHARGIVHRDLKPSNLFLPAGVVDQVKVLDFGIARREGRTQLTHTGMMVGSPGYMAPEQARGDSAIDARADVFALGCVLFLCLTGVPAFDGDSAAGILGKILFSEAPRVSELWADVPENLDVLVARMLSQNSSLRPSDGTNLAAALAALGPLAHGTGTTPKKRPGCAPASSTGERRFLAVVLLGPAAGGAEAAEKKLRQAIRAHGGCLEPLADGSMIVALEADRRVATDLAAQAARCALAVRAAAGDRPMAIAMGRTEAKRPLAHADTIDRAVRLLVRSPEAGTPVALDEVTAGLLDARFDVAETEAGFMLRGERALMQGARTLLGRPTACVGRDWELRALAGILDECIEEPQARVVVITAVAGMGKSRLAAEFVSRVRQDPRPMAIWMGRGDSLRAGSTLDLLGQALRGALGIQEGAPLAERRDRIRARVAERLPAAEQQRVAEFLGELVGTPFPNGETGSPQLGAARKDPQLMSEQMCKAWLDFVQAETAVQPVLLVFEDLHWGDFGTVRFIDTALRDCSTQPWMVLALARPEIHEVFPRLWVERRTVQEIRLKELGRKAGERLVRQVLGDSVGVDTVERLVTMADGNTFYLEELIRAVAEGKDKAGALPETVLAMVESRLARLPLAARRVLRTASVFGEVCWDGGVERLMGGIMEPASVAEWLAWLVDQEMLVTRSQSRFPGQRELAFRHALLREGAYATLTEEECRLEHGRAGDWLEQHGEGDPVVLAGHYERGGETEHAATFYLRAAEQAYHVRDLEGSMARTALGLGCAPREDLRLALLGLRCELASNSLQMLTEVMTDIEELLRAAPRGSGPWGQAMLAYLQGTLLAGRTADFMAQTELLREVEPAPEAVNKLALPFLVGVMMLDNLGQVSASNLLAERFTATVPLGEDRELPAQFWWNYIMGLRAFNVRGDPWRLFQHVCALETLYAATGGELYAMVMKLMRGIALWVLGASAEAECALEAIASADATLGVASSLRRFALSWLRADTGALDAARALAAKLSEDGHAQRNPLEESRGRWVLAEVLRRAGDLDAADRELTVALAMASPIEQPGVRATLAWLRLAQGRAPEALEAAEDALARASAMGGCGMFRGPFLRLVRAEALHATGQLDAARGAIAEARTRLLALADQITEPAYRRTFIEAVPENARTFALAREWLGERAPAAPNTDR